jgi:hypothetical protein
MPPQRHMCQGPHAPHQRRHPAHRTRPAHRLLNSIYEYKAAGVAAHWVKAMKVNGDWRQVGRFALAWTARDQKLTSDERRTELVAALKKATAGES